MSSPIYLDYSATTPMDPQVIAAMQPYFTDKFYNPSARYQAAKMVAADLATARASIAHWFGAKPSEIIFTAGATEANNLAIHGIMQRFPNANLVVASIEHEAVLEPAKRYQHQFAAVDNSGRIAVDKLGQCINDQTVLVSIMYANNEIGTIQPLKEIATAIEAVKKKRQTAGNTLPLYFHSDAAQAAGYLDIHAKRLGVDLMSINGSKIYGPKQSGVLYVSSAVQLEPQILGGGQERGLRSGTENVAGCIGLAKALDLVQLNRHTETARLQKLREHFMKRIELAIPATIINGSRKQRLPNNVHVTFPGVDNERLMMQLDELGILCATGSACSAARGVPSHVLTALGLDDQTARSSLRFTLGKDTTSAQLEKVVNNLQVLLS